MGTANPDSFVLESVEDMGHLFRDICAADSGECLIRDLARVGDVRVVAGCAELESESNTMMGSDRGLEGNEARSLRSMGAFRKGGRAVGAGLLLVGGGIFTVALWAMESSSYLVREAKSEVGKYLILYAGGGKD